MQPSSRNGAYRLERQLRRNGQPCHSTKSHRARHAHRGRDRCRRSGSRVSRSCRAAHGGPQLVVEGNRKPSSEMSQARNHNQGHRVFAFAPADAADFAVGDEGAIGPDAVLVEAAPNSKVQRQQVPKCTNIMSSPKACRAGRGTCTTPAAGRWPRGPASSESPAAAGRGPRSAPPPGSGSGTEHPADRPCIRHQKPDTEHQQDAGDKGWIFTAGDSITKFDS